MIRKENRLIKVVDSIMGSGKTSYIIQLLNDINEWAGEPPKYLVVTPYKDQVDYIVDRVSSAVKPKDGKAANKSKQLVEFLQQKKRVIVCTHELLNRFSDFELLAGYTLLIDETMAVIEPMWDDGDREKEKVMAVADLEILEKAGCIRNGKDGFYEWIAEEYRGLVYAEMYKHLRNGEITIRDGRVFKLLSRRLFTYCQEVVVFTYLFEGQDMYYYCRYFDIPIEYWHVVNDNGAYDIAPGRHSREGRNFPITIYEGRLNDIGEKGLSKNWFISKATDGELTRLRKNIYSYLRNDRKAGVHQVIWTTFKCYAGKIATKDNRLCTVDRERKGIAKKGNFVPCTSRATNNYREASVVVYAVNRFHRPEVKNFWDMAYDEELFALQEMLQFIWRSGIREGKPIHAYIPSKRMRDMLTEWLSGRLYTLTTKDSKSVVNFAGNP
jgi:hypothetical protein